MAEKNILAYFRTAEEAEGAARKLRALRALDVSVSRISPAYDAGAGRADMEAADEYETPAELTAGIGADVPERSADILRAAGPDASGMSDRGGGGAEGRSVLLAAVVDEGVHRQALKVVEEAGGLG